VEVVPARFGIECPGRTSERGEPVVRRLIRPVVPLRVLAKPGVLERSVARNQIEDDAEVSRMGVSNELVEVRKRAELGMDAAVVTDVVAQSAFGEG
jgi:hypothetical protein